MKGLVLRAVTVRIGGNALFAPLSLQLEPGTVTSVVGPSGSGKSSLLNYLCGFVPPGITGEGAVLIGEEDLTSMPPEARGLGKLFQDPLLFPHLDVAGNLLFGLRGGGSRRDRQQRVNDALSAVGLEGFAARDPATLSGGQQARVALLRVLLSEPRALLLDEPFRALDDDNRERVRKLVFTEATRRGLPTLLVTHDQDDVAAAGGPVVELEASA